MYLQTVLLPPLSGVAMGVWPSVGSPRHRSLPVQPRPLPSSSSTPPPSGLTPSLAAHTRGWLRRQMPRVYGLAPRFMNTAAVLRGLDGATTCDVLDRLRAHSLPAVATAVIAGLLHWDRTSCNHAVALLSLAADAVAHVPHSAMASTAHPQDGGQATPDDGGGHGRDDRLWEQRLLTYASVVLALAVARVRNHVCERALAGGDGPCPATAAGADATKAHGGDETKQQGEDSMGARQQGPGAYAPWDAYFGSGGGARGVGEAAAVPSSVWRSCRALLTSIPARYIVAVCCHLPGAARLLLPAPQRDSVHPLCALLAATAPWVLTDALVCLTWRHHHVAEGVRSPTSALAPGDVVALRVTAVAGDDSDSEAGVSRHNLEQERQQGVHGDSGSATVGNAGGTAGTAVGTTTFPIAAAVPRIPSARECAAARRQELARQHTDLTLAACEVLERVVALHTQDRAAPAMLTAFLQVHMVHCCGRPVPPLAPSSDHAQDATPCCDLLPQLVVRLVACHVSALRTLLSTTSAVAAPGSGRSSAGGAERGALLPMPAAIHCTGVTRLWHQLPPCPTWLDTLTAGVVGWLRRVASPDDRDAFDAVETEVSGLHVLLAAVPAKLVKGLLEQVQTLLVKSAASSATEERGWGHLSCLLLPAQLLCHARLFRYHAVWDVVVRQRLSVPPPAEVDQLLAAMGVSSSAELVHNLGITPAVAVRIAFQRRLTVRRHVVRVCVYG